MNDLRTLIRDVLQQELAALRNETPVPNRTREEQVSLRTDAELAAFVARLLRMAQDSRLRADIEAGRHVFRLASGPAPQVQAHQPTAPASHAAPAPVRFERGLVTEREIAKLPDGLRSIGAGKTVRFTPLARDELRRLNIKIERTTP